MREFEIRQVLDPTQLLSLSEEDRELADESGELDGNQHYQDLSIATWDDVAHALSEEARLIALVEGAGDPEAAITEISEALGAQDEREALWHLELGVAAPVMALNALGGHTALSCNGGAFGGVHLRDHPSVRFYPGRASIQDLIELAHDSGVALENEDGRVLFHGRTVHDLQRFAVLALERFGGRQGR